jgi:hypothetical protein
MDLSVVEDKEFHLAVFVDNQLIVPELSRVLRRPVGGDITDEGAEDDGGTKD